MTDAQYLQEILADPEADGPRLRYADWLAAQGNPRGEFIRVQCELEDPPDPLRAAALHQQSQTLLEQHRDEWLGSWASWTSRPVFRRGFVEEAEINAEALLTHAEELVPFPSV